MSNFSRWRRLSLALAAVSMLLTACFRDTSEALMEQPVAREYPSPTAELEEEPTSPPATDTPEPTATESVADEFALTATAMIALETEPAAGPESTSAAALTGSPVGAVQATLAPTIARATIPPGEDCYHEIRAGETLFQLSLAYGVTVDAIAEASAISNPDRIAVGQQITIPLCGTTGFIPPPTSSPTATFEAAAIPPTSTPDVASEPSGSAEIEIASSDETRDALIAQAQETLLDNAQANPLDDFSAQLSGAATPSQTYTVRQNDTLFGIAARFGITVEVLALLNDIDDVDSLKTGDVLLLP